MMMVKESRMEAQKIVDELHESSQSCQPIKRKDVAGTVSWILAFVIVMLAVGFVWQGFATQPNAELKEFMHSRGPTTPGDVLAKCKELQEEVSYLKAELAETKAIVIKNRELAEANKAMAMATRKLAVQLSDVIDLEPTPAEPQ